MTEEYQLSIEHLSDIYVALGRALHERDWRTVIETTTDLRLIVTKQLADERTFSETSDG